MIAIPTEHLPTGNACLQSLTMDDYKEHWRLRLKELFDSTRLSQAHFSGLIDVSPDYLSRLFYAPEKKGRKNVGLAIVRKVSEAFNLPPGWFDLPLGQGLPHLPPGNNAAPKAQEPAPLDTPSIKLKREIDWPFKIVTYQRIDKVRRHFSGRDMPAAMSDIDQYLNVLVTRWEIEMNKPKRVAN